MSDKRRRSSHWPDWPTFVGEGETWLLRQVMFDAALPPHAPRVANAIRMSVNFAAGVAEVGVGKIAAVLGLSDDTVTRCIAALNDRGHIALAAGRGRGNVHRIGWAMKAETRTGTFAGLTGEAITGLSEKAADRLREIMGEENTAAVRGFSEENTASLRGFSGENPAEEDVKPRSDAPKTPQGCGTYIPSNDLSNDQGGRPPYPRGGETSRDEISDAEPGNEVALPSVRRSPATRRKDQVIDGEVLWPEDHARVFAAIFDGWPKKTDRDDAARAFGEVIKRGAHVEDIARGAAAYVADRKRDRRGPQAVRQYCTPLAKWLREGSWATWADLPAAEASALLTQQEAIRQSIADAETVVAAAKRMPF